MVIEHISGQVPHLLVKGVGGGVGPELVQIHMSSGQNGGLLLQLRLHQASVTEGLIALQLSAERCGCVAFSRTCALPASKHPAEKQKSIRFTIVDSEVRELWSRLGSKIRSFVCTERDSPQQTTRVLSV
jgi:hypothetical protein